MPLRPALLGAVTASLLLFSRPAAAQIPTMPPDVLAIMAKVQQGQVPSAAELARLREWSQQMRGGLGGSASGGGAAPGGAPALPPAGSGDPPPAAAIPPGAIPPGAIPPGMLPPDPSQPGEPGGAADRQLKGTLTIAVEERLLGDRADLTYQGSVSLPVIYKLHDDGKQLNLGFQPDPAGGFRIRFSGRGRSTHDACNSTHRDSISYRLSASGKNRSGQLNAAGELVATASGSPRADVLLVPLSSGVLTATCPCGGGSQPSPVGLAPLTVDGLRGDVPFRFHNGLLTNVPAGLDVMSKLDAKMRAAVEGATFSFDPSSLRAARDNGGHYQDTVTYRYSIEDSTHLDMTTRLTLDINFVNGKIQVNPDPPKRADTVTLTANVQGGSKFHWTVTPGPCPQTGYGDPPTAPSAERDGKSWTFKALCDFHVKLHSETDDGNSSDDERDVTVAPRDGKEISFADDAPPVNKGQGEISLTKRALGMNRCTEQKDLVIANDHDGWIHSKHDADPHDFSAFLTVKTVDDDGPFAGMGYLETHALKISRKPILNGALFTGPLVKLNESMGNGQNLAALRASVLTHEHAHTRLARAWIDQHDPASTLEKFVAQGDEKKKANDLASHIDDDIGLASSEEAVSAELNGLVSGNEILCFPGEPMFQDCGPLADEGTPKAPPCHVLFDSNLEGVPCAKVSGKGR